jgi:hypothetical protein
MRSLEMCISNPMLPVPESRSMRWTLHVTYMKEIFNMYKILLLREQSTWDTCMHGKITLK